MMKTATAHHGTISTTRMISATRLAPSTRILRTHHQAVSTNAAPQATADVALKVKRGDIRKAKVEYDQRPSLSSIEPRGSVAAVILGGGETDSRRMFPLTDKRTLPAIPVGGIYRLIDIPMSNLINSGVNKIYILAQYQSSSLNRYLTGTYDFQSRGIPMGGDGFMEVVAATQDPSSQRWAEGSADSVRQFMELFTGNSRNRFCNDIIILPSDQIYRMDFCQVIEAHRASGADLTIVCQPVSEAKADHFGIVKMEQGSNRITGFQEKPTGEDKTAMSMDWNDLDDFLDSGTATLKAKKHEVHAAGDRAFVGSCGMYVFKVKVLQDLLSNKKIKDLGRELIPQAVKGGHKVMAYNFDGFWEDIGGSIEDYYNFSMKLVQPDSPFSFETVDHPFFASPQNLPPVLVDDCVLRNAMIGPGSKVKSSELVNSIIGARSLIGAGCSIHDSVIMGADYYESEKEWRQPLGPSFPAIGVGAGTTIHKSIIDKNARIGVGCKLLNKEGVFESFDRMKSGICIRDGIIVVSKSCVLPDGTVI